MAMPRRLIVRLYIQRILWSDRIACWRRSVTLIRLCLQGVQAYLHLLYQGVYRRQ
jgi:hypothetical protein